jgi:hypothetical protein
LTRFAEAVVGALRTPMVIITQQLQVLAVSPPFRALLATRDDPRGQDLLSLDWRRWDLPELRQALANVLPQAYVRRSGDNSTLVKVALPALRAIIRYMLRKSA